MTTTRSVSDRIVAEVTSWPGVHAAPGDLGELSFKSAVGRSVDLHGDRAAHFGFPKKIWVDLRKQGRIVPHPVFPHSQGPAAHSHRERGRRSRGDRALPSQLRPCGGPVWPSGEGVKRVNMCRLRHDLALGTTAAPRTRADASGSSELRHRSAALDGRAVCTGPAPSTLPPSRRAVRTVSGRAS